MKTIKKQNKEIFAFCFNITILLLSIVGTCILCDTAKNNASTILKYYTHLSNFFIGIAASICIIYTILKWTGKVKEIPCWVNIVKLIAVATVALTMIVTVLFLTPSIAANNGNPSSLYKKSNLIFHVVTPVVAIVSYLLFEQAKDIKLVKTLYGLIPNVLYTVFYIVETYTHIQNGEIMSGYDWYGFASFGHVAAAFICIALFAIYYGIIWALWCGNRKINIKSLA